MMPHACRAARRAGLCPLSRVTSHRGTTLDGRDSKIDMPVIDTVEAAQQRMIHWLADVSQGTDAFPVLVRRPAHACRLYSKP